MSNDRVIVEQLIEHRHNEAGLAIESSTFFTMFTVQEMLKDYDLSYDEIISGIVDGGNDGGIDGFYIFLNNSFQIEPIEQPSDSYKRGHNTLDVHIIQSSRETGFKEARFNALLASIGELFSLEVPVEELENRYNSKLLEKIEVFRSVHKETLPSFPKLNFYIHYACLGDKPHPNVVQRGELLKSTFIDLFDSSSVQIHFWGVREILSSARRQPKRSFDLQIADSIAAEIGVAYVCFVRLTDYVEFISVRDGDNVSLFQSIFEANVRDFQGKTQVNEQIRESLARSNHDGDFWWLNNGITVIATKASASGKILTIENPSIVNGLQTSYVMFDYFRNNKGNQDSRKLLVRVIVEKNPEAVDRIIQATNSQTAVPPASLRATDKIHRDIEQYLISRGLFYDRRKNAHKNAGRPVDKIVGIPQLAQAVMAMLLQRSNVSRSRPSSITNNDKDYEQVFNESHEIGIYFTCFVLLKRIEKAIKDVENIDPKAKGDIKWHVTMDVAARACSTSQPTHGQLAGLDPNAVKDELISNSVARVHDAYIRLGATNQIAKGSELRDEVVSVLERDFPRRYKS